MSYLLFDDLYFNNQFSKSSCSKTEDLECHDIRILQSIWWKASVNFIEVLFSREIIVNPDLTEDSRLFLYDLLDNPTEIANMNLIYLYDVCIGTYFTTKNQIDKVTDGTRYLVDAFGYDTKNAMNSVRILDFLIRFAESDLSDFGNAIWYGDNEPNRRWLLDIKAGLYSKEEYLQMAGDLFERVEVDYKHIYKSQQPNEATNQYLLDTFKRIVSNELG